MVLIALTRSRPKASRKALAASRRQAWQGRCPAASPTASSRKNSSVHRPRPINSRRGSRPGSGASVQITQLSVAHLWCLSVFVSGSWRMPRLPVKRPRCGTAWRRENGSALFWSGNDRQPINDALLCLTIRFDRTANQFSPIQRAARCCLMIERDLDNPVFYSTQSCKNQNDHWGKHIENSWIWSVRRCLRVRLH